MPRAAEPRLARLEARHPQPDRSDAHRRRYARFTLAICAAIRAAAEAAGIDPATISALRFGDEAAAEFAALADTQELAAADAAEAEAASAEWHVRHPGEPDPREELRLRLQRIGRHYADGTTPGPNGSLAGWHAWALIQPPRPGLV